MKQLDYSKALTWYTKDTNFWPTVLTLSLYVLSCIFILPMLYVIPYIAGYIVKLTRNIQAEDYTLPDIKGSYWNDGIVIVFVSFVVAAIVGALTTFLMFGSALFSYGHVNPRDYGTINSFALFSQFLGFGLQFFLSLILPLVSFLGYAIYAKTGSLRSLFTVDNYKIAWQNNTWSIVIGYFLYSAVTSALAMVGIFACCIGILPAVIVSNFILAGIVGQFDVTGVE